MNTYGYDEVVRIIPQVGMYAKESHVTEPLTMPMLQMLLASRGSIRAITHLDFVNMYCTIAHV